MSTRDVDFKLKNAALPISETISYYTLRMKQTKQQQQNWTNP